MHLSLRKAVVNDAPLLEHWDKQPHVQAATMEPAFFADWAHEIANPPDWRELLIAQLDKRPLGLLHIIDPAREPSHYWGAIDSNLRALDIWIGDAADLDRGYGTTIMQLAHHYCFATASVSAILIDPLASNTAAHRFYQRLGYQLLENRIFDGHMCHVYRLTRTDFTGMPPVSV